MKQNIKVTDDYKIFRRIKGNRQLSKSHIKNLVKVFEKDKNVLAYDPVLVNEELEVIDGQHRVEAAKLAKAPVYYIIYKGLKLKDVQALNSNTKPWTPMDYAVSYSENGDVNYQLYIDFALAYPFNHDVLRTVLSQNRCKSLAFKQGNFQIYNIKGATDFFDRLVTFKPFSKKFNNRSFALAFQKLFANPDYDHDHMIEQLHKHPEMLNDHSDPISYLRELEAIYNLNARGENRVRFF